jgi:hypothetical protein
MEILGEFVYDFQIEVPPKLIKGMWGFICELKNPWSIFGLPWLPSFNAKQGVSCVNQTILRH